MRIRGQTSNVKQACKAAENNSKIYFNVYDEKQVLKKFNFFQQNLGQSLLWIILITSVINDLTVNVHAYTIMIHYPLAINVFCMSE